MLLLWISVTCGSAAWPPGHHNTTGGDRVAALGNVADVEPSMRRGGASAIEQLGQIFGGQRMLARRCAWGRGQSSKRGVCVSTSSISSAFCCRFGCSTSQPCGPFRSLSQSSDQASGGAAVLHQHLGKGISTRLHLACSALQHPVADLAGGRRCWRRAVYPAGPTNYCARYLETTANGRTKR